LKKAATATRDDIPRPELECSVCGAFKLSHEDYCSTCSEYRQRVIERQRMADRRRKWGALWQ
jgi:hypothetical protein